MKKIRISESELVDLIEKLVKESIGNGTGFDFGMLGTPTSKYKDLYEDEDVEGDITEQIRIKRGKGFFDIEVTWKWPQLPDWLRRLFIRKNKNKGGKWLKCTLDSCPAWDDSSTDEKKEVSAEIEGDESKEEATEEFNYDTAQTGDKTLNVNVMKQTNQTDWMGENKITESQLVRRLSRKLNEETTVGCANKPAGCIRKGSYTHTDEDTGEKTTYPWHILNNKEDGIWRGCSSEENCKEQLAAIHV